MWRLMEAQVSRDVLGWPWQGKSRFENFFRSCHSFSRVRVEWGRPPLCAMVGTVFCPFTSFSPNSFGSGCWTYLEVVSLRLSWHSATRDTSILKLRGMLHVTIETITWNCFVGLASDSKVLARMDGCVFYLTSPFKICLSAWMLFWCHVNSTITIFACLGMSLLWTPTKRAWWRRAEWQPGPKRGWPEEEKASLEIVYSNSQKFVLLSKLIRFI